MEEEEKIIRRLVYEMGLRDGKELVHLSPWINFHLWTPIGGILGAIVSWICWGM